MHTLKPAIAALSLLFASVVSAAPGYSNMVVFGDSLSDPGNAFVFTGNVSVRPYDAGNIPSAPYPIGGLHFSDGSTWIENVSAALKLNGGTGPALRSPAFSNFAFGGARAGSGVGGPFDLSAQVGAYLASVGGVADGDALYTVFLGGNDVRDALVAFNVAFQTTLLGGGSIADAIAAGKAAAGAIIADAVSTIADNLVLLHAQGARHFLIPNVPNIGVAPAVTALGSDTANLAAELAFGFNAALAGALTGIESVFPVDITRLDLFTLISTLAAVPESFGLTNATDSCITPEVMVGAVCDNRHAYLFWDGIHPTAAGHALLAEAALDALQ